ncbi:SRPBCC family protein [Wenyingzhuangia sp. 2_MG-2023]|uniref:SRPBCC family protein n=1 Tax=Wenyingzhuangia sp. 2_MG-2023 TaxID=3062639 RepID=UPI0026E1BE91|nr:SRPBCC family protein [Wenyingzhuangia sp. 2_MG-2023]MDO6738022.1 SRPBCC family protein [Wenyingzhuangia sp. 2_MG-2023]
MKKFFLYGSAVIIVAILITGIFAPKGIAVERSVVIERPMELVFPFFASLKNQEQYSPWAAKDPKTIHTYTGIDCMVGSAHAWESNHPEVGKGTQEILEIKTNQEITTELKFIEPFEATSKAYYKFNSLDDATQVIWGYEQDYGFFQSIFMMFFDMDKILGADFEKGLTKAKVILEE